MNDCQSITMAQVRWNSVVVFRYFTGNRGRERSELAEYRKKAYSGEVKSGARKRMAKAVDLMVQFSRVRMKARPGGRVLPFRLGFVTLTVPGKVRSAKEVHTKCFKRFCDWLRYRDCLYIWKAEYQDRGQIHYHLIINQYIHFKDLNHGWNKIMKKAGYLDEYGRKHGHFYPPSTEVKSVKSEKRLTRYLLKYLQKPTGKPAKDPISKWWGASSTLCAERFSYEPGSADWRRLQSTPDAYRDPDGNFMIVKGSRSRLLSDWTGVKYKNWRTSRKSAKWSKAPRGSAVSRSIIVRKEKIRNNRRAQQMQLFQQQTGQD